MECKDLEAIEDNVKCTEMKATRNRVLIGIITDIHEFKTGGARVKVSMANYEMFEFYTSDLKGIEDGMRVEIIDNNMKIYRDEQ